jgi:hypothetical protein
MLVMILIVLVVLWLAGFFGPPMIPAIALPTIAFSATFVQALLIILVIVVIVALLR